MHTMATPKLTRIRLTLMAPRNHSNSTQNRTDPRKRTEEKNSLISTGYLSVMLHLYDLRWPNLSTAS